VHFRIAQLLLLQRYLYFALLTFVTHTILPCHAHIYTYTLHYRVLETLDLACNYFNSEPAIEAATRLPRVSTIKLYGNPILGETGEDPIYIYIEGNSPC
jgi:hypothetical protein